MLALLPVAGFYIWGISIPLLVLSVMGLAAMRMVFNPALQSAVPVLVKDREALQAINGLFDATFRLARLIGPMMAAVLNALLAGDPLPVGHGGGLRAVGPRRVGRARSRDRSREQAQAEPRRLARRLGCPARRRATDAERATTGALLLVNAFANGPWSVALQLAIALMVVEHDPHLFGFMGSAALGLIIGTIGVGDVIGNLVAGSVRFARPLSTMFLGYVAMGLGFALLALAAWGPAQPLQAAGHDAVGHGRRPRRAVLLHPHDHAHADRPLTAPRSPACSACGSRIMAGVDAGALTSAPRPVRPDRPDHTEFYLGLLLLGLGVVGHLYYRRRESA